MKPDRYRQAFLQQLQQGLHAAAAETLAAWLAKTPAAFEPRLLRIHLDLTADRYRDAHDGAAALVATANCPPEFAREVVECLKTFALHDPLVAWAKGYGGKGMMSPRDLSLSAISLSALGAHELALEWVELAVRKAPADPVGRLQRALILGYLGQFDRARADLQDIVSSPRQIAMAFWLLARIDRQTPQSNHVTAIRQALQGSGLNPGERAFLGHALFKELDDLGDHAGAWAALETGNRAARTGRRYDRASEEQIFSAIKRAYAVAVDVPIVDATEAAADDPVPIFIVGLHRSGTSLIERILGMAADVQDLGETQRFQVALRYGADRPSERVPDVAMLAAERSIDYALVRSCFHAAARTRSAGRRFATEKTPTNFLNVGAIRRALPRARIVHMRRQPRDLCFANYRELFGEGVQHTSDLGDLVHYHKLYQDLMSHWHKVFPGFVLDVDYETLVHQPEAESRRVFDFCGLDWSEGLSARMHERAAPVSTLSSMQVRQPVNVRSVGRWRDYAVQLEALVDAFPDPLPQT